MNRARTLRGVGLTISILALVGCGSHPSLQGYLGGSSSCTLAGGVGAIPPNYCVDYIGNQWFGPSGDQPAFSDCRAQFLACGSRCSELFRSGQSCLLSNPNLGVPVGSCRVASGKANAAIYHYYVPTGL